MSNQEPKENSASLPTEVIVQRPADARVIAPLPNSGTRFMFSGFAGLPDFYEFIGQLGGSPPLHRHYWATPEFVLEGRIRYCIDDVEYVVEARDFIYTPPDAVHSFCVESESARTVALNYPTSGFAELQERSGPFFENREAPDMQGAMRLAAELGIQIVGPPMQPAS